MANVSLIHLKKQFGQSVAVSDFSLEIADGELVSFLGPSGCGKTTTLRMIAGFIDPTAGRILIGGADVTALPVHQRNTGMVFQQQQRVAIARALAIEPKVFLLDEPLSNLDAKLRLEVREEIRTLQQRLGLTTIFVTHDQEEALAISDRMAIMHDGKVQQVGRPDSLYERPENFFVAEFLGKMNFFAGAYAGPGQFKTVDGVLLKVDGVTENTKQIGVRPERVELSHANVYENNIPVTVQSSAYLGSFLDVILVGPGQRRLSCQVPNTATGSPAETFATGLTFTMNFKASACVVFDEEGGA